MDNFLNDFFYYIKNVGDGFPVPPKTYHYTDVFSS